MLINFNSSSLDFDLHLVIPNLLHSTKSSFLDNSICSVLFVIQISVLFKINFLFNSINFLSTALSINAFILSVCILHGILRLRCLS